MIIELMIETDGDKTTPPRRYGSTLRIDPAYLQDESLIRADVARALARMAREMCDAMGLPK